MGTLREARAVFLKELRTEWRTRVAISSTALFAVGGVTLAALALQVRLPIDLERNPRAAVTAALLWTLLYFTAAAGLGRAFALEEERGTALALRLTARASAVWLGKFLANALLLLVLAALATPLLLTAIGVFREPVNVPLLSCVVGLGCIGMAAIVTFAGALVAQASAKGSMLAAVALPLLTPLFAAAVGGTKVALNSYIGAIPGRMAPFAEGLGDLQALLALAVISVTASLMLFEYIWND